MCEARVWHSKTTLQENVCYFLSLSLLHKKNASSRASKLRRPSKTPKAILWQGTFAANANTQMNASTTKATKFNQKIAIRGPQTRHDRFATKPPPKGSIENRTHCVTQTTGQIHNSSQLSWQEDEGGGLVHRPVLLLSDAYCSSWRENVAPSTAGQIQRMNSSLSNSLQIDCFNIFTSISICIHSRDEKTTKTNANQTQQW